MIAVHCKGGQGRTGTMICAWLLYSGQVSTAKEALEIFYKRRTSDESYARGCRIGPSVPSQLRIIHSFDQLLKSNTGPNHTDSEVQKYGGGGGGGRGNKAHASLALRTLALKNVRLHPIQRLSKMAGEGGFIRVNISDKGKRVLASQLCPVSADMLKVIYVLQNTDAHKHILSHTRMHTQFTQHEPAHIYTLIRMYIYTCIYIRGLF